MTEGNTEDPCTVRILSIDGGGIRGILPARVLQEIEQATKKPSKELFHLISGTSTGGIIACGLAAGLSAQQLGDLYAKSGGEIFAHSLWRTASTLFNLTGPKYSADTLEKKLQVTLGDRLLSTIDEVNLLIPSYCISLPSPVSIDGGRVQSTRNPFLFKSWKARGLQLNAGEVKTTFDFQLRDIARATSAAPTYFPAAQIANANGDHYWMVDGGLFANNPAMCAYVAARQLFPKATRFQLLSLGTGCLERPIDGPEASGWGEVGWLHPILSILMDGNADTVCYQLNNILGSDHSRMDISLGTDINDQYMVHEDFDDASPDNIARIELLAQKLIRDFGVQLSGICASLATPKYKGPSAQNNLGA